MLALYCDVERLVRPGDRVPVYVSTTSETFGLELYRVGTSVPVWRSDPLPGKAMPAGDPTREWNWPGYELRVPSYAPSGVYLVVGVELDGGSPRVDPSLVGYDGTAILAVTPREPGTTALYKLPVRTYMAYNPAGGTSLYANHVWRDGACVVTTRRPGAGTGGPTVEPVDVYGQGSARQTFWHWDAPFLAWAARRGYPLDVVFDTALDHEPALLDGYRALVTAGHDEYWTDTGRRLTEEFVDAGGSLAVFGANTCWWRAEVREGELRVAKNVGDTDSGDLWWLRGRSEARLLGLSYRNGGGAWRAARPRSRYMFRPDGDDLLTGVDLDVFAELDTFAGYEADGHVFAPDDPWRVSGVDGPPDGFVVLAYAKLTDNADKQWSREPREPGIESPNVATIGYYRKGKALVFNGGTTDWPRHLDHPAVDRLTRNVLDAVGAGHTPATNS